MFAEEKARGLLSEGRREDLDSVYFSVTARCFQHYGRETVDGCRKEEANLSSTATDRRRCEQPEGSLQSPFALFARQGQECGDQARLLRFFGSHSERSLGGKVDSNTASVLRERSQGISIFCCCTFS